MRCEDVERELTNEAATALSADAASHLAGCTACQRTREDYAHLTRVMRALPLWHAPAGFASSVARQAMKAGAAERAQPVSAPTLTDTFPWPMVFDTVGLSALAGVAAYGLTRIAAPLQPALGVLAAPAPELAWLWVAGSLLLAVRLSRSTS